MQGVKGPQVGRLGQDDPDLLTITLLGQWLDEIKKFAPSLVVKVYHQSFASNKKKKDYAKLCNRGPSMPMTDLRNVDILLCVATTKPPLPFQTLCFTAVSRTKATSISSWTSTRHRDGS